MEASPLSTKPYFGCDLCGYRTVPVTNPEILELGYGVERCGECGTSHWIDFNVLPPDGWSTSSRPLKTTKLVLLRET